MKEIIITGKNINSAIEEGLKSLNLTREDVDIKILEQGGLFKKAKVQLSYEEKKDGENIQAEEIKAEIEKQEPQQVETAVENSKDEELKIEEVEDKIKEESVEESSEIDEIAKMKNEILEILSTDEEPKKEIIEQQTIIEQQQEEEDHEEEKEEQPVQEIKKERKPVTEEDVADLKVRINDFLQGLVSSMGASAEISFKLEDGTLFIDMNSEKFNEYPNFNATTISSIQAILYSFKKGSEKCRLNFDINGKKKNRSEYLVNLAKDMARRCEETNRNVHLDNMNAYDRRIIHTTLQDYTTVTTISTGVEPNRHVVIMPKK